MRKVSQCRAFKAFRATSSAGQKDEQVVALKRRMDRVRSATLPVERKSIEPKVTDCRSCFAEVAKVGSAPRTGRKGELQRRAGTAWEALRPAPTTWTAANQTGKTRTCFIQL